MNKFILLIAGLAIIYILFTVLPMMVPTLSPSLFMPYAVWALVLMIFFLFLPGSVGGWVYDVGNTKTKTK